MANNSNSAPIECAIPIRACPFCSSKAEIVTAYDPIRYGVRCPVCSACHLPVYRTQAEALGRWNRRSGGAAASGGRATRGLRSVRKLAAAKRNLRAARAAKRLYRLKAQADNVITKDQPIRVAEIVQAETQAAENPVRLTGHDAQTVHDPSLSRIYALLTHAQLIDGVSPPMDGD